MSLLYSLRGEDQIKTNRLKRVKIEFILFRSLFLIVHVVGFVPFNM